jgi:phospholipase C
MKFLPCSILVSFVLSLPSFASVTVTSPTNGATVSSPVTFAATATAPTCSTGVSAVGVYIDNTLAYHQTGSSLSTSLTIAAGTHQVVVQEWDNCGGATSTSLNIIVPGSAPAGVTVTSPANNSTVTSPVTFVASATTTTCAKGIASMGIYVGSTLKYTVNGSSLNTSLVLSTGPQSTVVQAWDNCGGVASKPINLTVQSSSAATVTLSASPASIAAGSSSTLTVTAANATQVILTGTDKSSYTLKAAGGTQTVTPAATVTYTATATGSTGNVSASATVTVTAAAPTVTVSASPASVAAGASSVLTVTATKATQVTVAGSDGSSYTLAASGGSETVSPTATTTYTATATGTGGKVSAAATVTVTAAKPTIAIAASPVSIVSGGSSTLTLTASNATQVKVTGTDGSSYTLQASGGSQVVTPTATTTYTAVATGSGGTASTSTAVTVTSGTGLQSIAHVVFMLQENHSFDNYFGMLNPYRAANKWNVGADGKTYSVDGIDDKLTTLSNESDEGTVFPLFKFTSTCVEDLTSSWLESYGDVSRWDFGQNRAINIDGFVHTAENFAKNCSASGGTSCSGTFSDFTGKRAMGYYDQGFLNYDYFMASQFAVSDRWFSPVSSKSTPNRIATFTGGTTQGLVFDPGSDDHLSQLTIPTIFEELSQSKVTWKIYYTVTQGSCLDAEDCQGGASAQYPATDFTYFTDSYQYLHENPSGAACVAPTEGSSVVGDASNSFCIDPTHIAPLATYYTDLANGTLPSFAFIEAGYGVNDEHPGSGQSILAGQQEVAKVVNAFMASSLWKQSVFFLSYDEGGGPYDHVPPVQGHSNDHTDATLGSASVSSVPDIASISVNPDGYYSCVPSGSSTTLHCDLVSSDPGAQSTSAAAVEGFAAQLGFRVPNLIISPFTRKHYVSHIPMDHTAILKFVENRFIGPNAHLTARDAAQPDLLDFFDFTGIPWATPPTPPTPVSVQSLGYDPCTPTKFAP